MAGGGGRERRGGGRLLVGVLLLTLVVSGHCLESTHHRGLKRRRRKHEIHSPIKTVVVVVMENRSFDHILGWLSRTRPDIDGLNGTQSNRLNASDPSSPEIFVTDEAGYVDSDPGHGFEDIREQIFGSADTSAVPAPMSGFAQNARGMGLGMPQNVMSGFKPESVPVYAALADEFAVFDRWFASVPTSTQPRSRVRGKGRALA